MILQELRAYTSCQKLHRSIHLSFKDSVCVHTCKVLTYVAANKKYGLLRSNSKCQAAYEHQHMGYCYDPILKAEYLFKIRDKCQNEK